MHRFLQLIPILLGITFLSFAMMRLAGSDVVTEMYQNRGTEVSQEIIDAKRAEIGFVERSLLLNEECLACEYFHICHGSCQRNRDFNELTGKYENYFCESYKMFFADCLPRMEEMAKALGKR